MPVLHGTPPELIDRYLEILLSDVADRAVYRSLRNSNRGRRNRERAVEYIKLVLGMQQTLAQWYYQFLTTAPDQKSGSNPSTLFSIVRMAYLLGSAAPDKMMTEELTDKAAEKTKGRKPKWHPVADTFLTDELLSKIRNKRLTVRNVAISMLPKLNRKLKELKIRLISERTLRDYVSKKVGKQRL
jgi:hypothetical protein